MAPTAKINAQLAEALELLSKYQGESAEVRTEALYAQWYAKPRYPFALPSGCPPDLAGILQAAHFGHLQWESGWRVENVGPRGQAVVRRGKEVRLLERIDYSPGTRRGLLPRQGEDVSVSSRRDRVDSIDGWWRTSGPGWVWTKTPPSIVRLYFESDVFGLPSLVTSLTRILMDETEPWLLKCALDPSQYARSDAIIAYLTPRAIERHAIRIDGLIRSRADHGQWIELPLTLKIAPGVSAAIDPGGEESFGMHRCRLIVEAARNDVSAVIERFAADGISFTRPWARAGDPLLPWEL